MFSYPLYRKKAYIEVVHVFDDGDVLVQNCGDDSDQWVISKETFEAAYERVE